MKILFYLLFIVIPKKITSFFVYPFAYLLRKKVWRSTKACNGDWQLDEVRKHNKGWKLLVWFFLNDSIYSETGKEYNTKRKNLYKWTHNDFINGWYWSGFKNTSNNLSHWLAKGKMIKVTKTYSGKHYLYEVREFPKGVYPYIEVYIKGLKFNVGWLTSGKFEGIKVRKRNV